MSVIFDVLDADQVLFQGPHEIIEMYNGVIDGIRDALTNTDLVDVSWPMAEAQSHGL